ncbi:hypothetical protein ACVIM8_001756 [Bradyrhizobium sp. USDA 4529]
MNEGTRSILQLIWPFTTRSLNFQNYLVAQAAMSAEPSEL